MLWLLTQFGDACHPTFFSFPTWYEYLKPDPTTCAPTITGLNDVWLIVAAVIEILLRVGALAAIGLVIYGGFEYMTSRGEPEKTNQARQTIINALVGLVITVLAAVIVNFVAGSIK